MIAEQARALARYNIWMNEAVYRAAASLPDAERKKDRGAFFRSIHGTLNHILLADLLWLGRFQRSPYAIDGLDDELHADFDALRAERVATDEIIARWVAGLSDEDLRADFEFTTFVNPKPRVAPLWGAVTHLFNHQTHHRGQVTTLLSQRGVDLGVTDFVYTEGLVRER